MTEDYPDETIPQVGGIGARLRTAREAQGLTIPQVAAETRIPQRHLETIEEGNFAALPARTYAVGFSRTYARLLGLDGEEVAEEVRAELDAQDTGGRGRPASFEPGDPARVPSRALGWLSIAAVVMVLAGLFFAARTFFAPAGELPSLVAQDQAQRAALAAQQRAAAAPATAANATGPVVFTALEDGIWVKFYDANGAQLMQKLMAKDESYTVPADADGPQLWTGRPDALGITVGGRSIAKLADDDVVMKDVPITAAALMARAPAAAATPAGPAPRASPTA
ncbi:MAG: helix-turn-helix domain-containing protein [Croceibacterium sp.]